MTKKIFLYLGQLKNTMKKNTFSLFIILVLVSFITPKSHANPEYSGQSFADLSKNITVIHHTTARFVNRDASPGHPLHIRINRITKLFFKKKGPTSLKGGRNKRITAAILAFPLPLGILGVHRLYLGTKPIVPIIYIVTLGGVVGILPFIDFVVLLLADDIQEYEDNPHVFMWTNN